MSLREEFIKEIKSTYTNNLDILFRSSNENYIKWLEEKAYHFDYIKKGIAEFYTNEKEDQDLEDIGEWIASYFNWI